MFAVYTEQGRDFRNTLEELYRVRNIQPVKQTRRVLSEEQEEGEREPQFQTQPNREAIQAYRQVISARREEAIHHASQIMKRPVITVAESSTLEDCYDLMESKGFKQLPVLNDESRPVGLITKENLLKVVIVENGRVRDAEIDRIKEIMSQPLITADPVTDIRRVAKVMYDQDLNCIPITNEADLIVGIITRTDIVHAVSIYPGITLWA